jgi:hypothetical protein
MTGMFSFDARDYAATFASQGFVHMPQCVSEEFFQVLSKQVDDYLRGELLADFAIGDKQQALYQFPPGRDYYGELIDAVSGVCGVEADSLVLSERHIKAYEDKAVPDPLAHKDRFASEFAVGITVRVTPGSTLVLYPYDERTVNPFNSSTELRASFRPECLPEASLRHARRVEITDAPRDVIIFRGHSMWHLRAKPAGTVMLYLKLNTLNCDPLGEDPTTAGIRERTTAFLSLIDSELSLLTPLVGRRVDYIQRRYNRDWQEVAGVVLWGERHVSIDQDEWRALQAIDGRRSVRDVIDAMGPDTPWDARAAKLRSLATRGIVDLMPAPRAASLPLGAEAGSRKEATLVS